jgi:hypothetical protein
MANLMLFASAADIYCRDAQYRATMIGLLKSIPLVLVPVFVIISRAVHVDARQLSLNRPLKCLFLNLTLHLALHLFQYLLPPYL